MRLISTGQGLPTWQGLPFWFWGLAGLYLVASFTHFAHNAEYLAYYPNMPVWIARGTVYKAWLMIAAVGALGMLLIARGWLRMGLLFVGVFGALGLDGFAHYGLAPCSAHTLFANATIWGEGLSGLAVAIVALSMAVNSPKRFALRSPS